MANVDDLKRNTKKLSEKILTLLAWLFLFLIFFLFNIGLTRKVLSSGKPYLAVVFYFVGVVFAVVLPFVILGMARATFWWHRTKKDQLLEKQQKFRPDGQPHPPTQRGLCDNCGLAFEKVYHLKSGVRLCTECYQEFLK